LCLDGEQPQHTDHNRLGSGEPERDTLHLTLQSDPLDAAPLAGTPLLHTENWELWRDARERLVFSSLLEFPSLKITIESDFSSGSITGNFPALQEFDPLQDLGIKIFINWLAARGEVLLHASGVIAEDGAYAFIGASGAGKSTAAALLAKERAITVLGEDQVVLRSIDGKFWIFGTPWHLNPSMCSPLGSPLKKLFFLERDDEAKAVSLSPDEGVTRLVQTAFIPFYQPGLVPGILENLAQLYKSVPFYSLSFTLDGDLYSQVRNA